MKIRDAILAFTCATIFGYCAADVVVTQDPAAAMVGTFAMGGIWLAMGWLP